MKTSIPSFMVLFTALEPRTTDSPTRGNFTVTFSYSHLRDVQFLIVYIACLRSRKCNASLPMERDSSPSPTGIASCGCVTVILPWYLLCWLVIWDCSAMDEQSKCFFTFVLYCYIFFWSRTYYTNIWGAILFICSGLSIVSSLHKSLGWSIHDFRKLSSLVRFPQISGQTSSMRKGINFGRSRVRTQFLRKISEVNLGNIPIPSKK